MIPAKDLRIGNIISNTERTFVVDANTIYDIEAFGCEFVGVPLTPEWLEKIGFKQSETRFTWDYGKLSIHLPSLSYKYGRTYFNSWYIIEYAVTYLHQLQNLYHALTNEELKIEL